MCSCLLIELLGVFSTCPARCPRQCPTCAARRYPHLHCWRLAQTLGLGKILLAPLQRLLLSSSRGRLTKAGRGDSPCHRPAGVPAQPQHPSMMPSLVPCLALGTRRGRSQGDAYALQAASYRWSDLFNALWLLFTFAGYSVGAASFRAIWEIHLKTSFWRVIIRKKKCLQHSDSGRKVSC